MKTAFQVFNGFAPKEYPKILREVFSFSAASQIVYDLLNENTSGVIDFVQSMYVDNVDNSSPIYFSFPITGHRVICPSFSQGVFPVYSVDQFQAIISCANSAAVVHVHWCNFPQAYYCYSVS